MEILAHSLWATAAAITAKRLTTTTTVRIGWTVWWAVFPDVLAFGPSVAAGIWLRLTGGLDASSAHGGHLPHVNLGLPIYPAVHSLVVFLLVFGITTILARRVVVDLFGWLLHILIDIPTHSFSFYATRFLWPLSGYRVDGIAWWTPLFWVATYAALAVLYIFMWRKGWLSLERTSAQTAEVCVQGRPKRNVADIGRDASV
jgi:hypothetical protein